MSEHPPRIDERTDTPPARRAGAFSLLAYFAPEAAYEGWAGNRPAENAAKAAGCDPFEIRRTLGESAAARLEAYSSYLDGFMEARAAEADFAGLSIRGKMRELILARLAAAEALPSGKEALRKAMHYYAVPGAAKAPKAAWATSDRMWRICGDASVDFNYYSKRALLAGVYAAVLLYRLEDESEDLTAVGAFAERRLNDVVKIGSMLAGKKPRFPGGA